MAIQLRPWMRMLSLIISVLLAMSISVAAQVTTADVVGRVTDSSGAVLPGVTIVIENVGTGLWSTEDIVAHLGLDGSVN